MTSNAPNHHSNKSLTLRLLSRIRQMFNTQGDVARAVGSMLERNVNTNKVLSESEKRHLAAAMAFHQKTVDEISIPRSDLVFLELHDNFKTVVKIFHDTKHASLPVMRGTPDDVVGYAHLTDIVGYIGKEKDFALHTLLRPCIYIPETVTLDDALKEFRNTKSTMAIVVDEYGGTSGLVTLRSIAAEIVGEVGDHNHPEQLLMIPLPGGRYQVDPRTPVDYLCERLGGLTLPTYDADGGYDTIGGMVLAMARRFPKADEVFDLRNGHSIKVIEVASRRITKLQLIPDTAPQAEQEPHSTETL